VLLDEMSNDNNDVNEARALSFNPNHIDIYSCSWGPIDDGKTLEGPGPLAKQALLNGTTSGRHGLGSIYVFATGNGGGNFDSCSCDGYASSIYTMSITAATQSGLKPFYTEECSSTLAATPSSGNNELDGMIATTTVDARLRPEHLYTTQFSGTSASAALASGVSALALEANRNLTWRDLQYLVVVSSNPKPLLQEQGWSMNGVGRQFSHKFGYGLMDADAMVQMAQSWKTLPPQHICQTPIMLTNTRVPDDLGQGVNVSIRTDACFRTNNAVHYLEHVQCKITLKFYPRGNVLLALTSPVGTRYLAFWSTYFI
jgi:proprotein convertase subtilisin/kexin type 5